jgi:hypothetical protein
VFCGSRLRRAQDSKKSTNLYGRFKKSAEGHYALTERLMKRDDDLFELLRLQKAVTEGEADLLRKTRRELVKLRDVYYHVFPERLAEDVRLLEEQEAVNLKAAPDVEK